VRAASPEKVVLIIAIGDSTTAGTPFFKSPLEVPPRGKAIGGAIQLLDDETAAANGGLNMASPAIPPARSARAFLDALKRGRGTSSFWPA